MKTPTTFILSLTIIITLAAGSAFGAYSGGTGEPNNPYQISRVEDWQELMTTPADWWNQHFILTADVNLAGVTLTPVGNSSTWFTGVFDGNDNIISNAVINQPGSNYIGLFGYVACGQIRNLGIEDVNITGRNYVGGLVGWNNVGTITGCYASGSVSGTSDYVGGLVGWNWSGLLTACYATGSATGRYSVGGLMGANHGTLISCYATGSVIGTGNDAGGLVGNNRSGSLTSCYATGSVSGTSGYVGGLVGYNESGTITSCYASGSVSGDYAVGGLVGGNYPGSLTSCYATGSVTGRASVGGLVGGNYGTLTSCYATGSASGTVQVGGLVGYNSYRTLTACYATGSVSGTNSVGGLVGRNDSDSVLGSFWDTETSGRPTSAGGEGKTTAEMMTLSTFIDAGWDFVGETANGTEDIWTICEGVDYPKFAWQNQLPIADAGPDQTVYVWIDGIAEVTLDGSDSNDADGDELTYKWMWTIDANTYEANSVSPTIELPVGVHRIQLVVNDGHADSAPDEVNIIVKIPPVAEAGPEQTVYAKIDGKAEVTLDGSDSNDADGDELTYKWTWAIDANTYEANSVSPTIELPVGMHTIQLVVNDGIVDSAPDDVNVTVVAPLTGKLQVMPCVINSRSNQPHILAVIELDNIVKSDINADELLTLYSDGIKAMKQWMFTSKDIYGKPQTTIFAFFDKDALMATVPENGDNELKVAGKLESGQYFYGCDTVKVIK